MAFTKKRGTAGWPGPQARAIQRAAELLGLDLDYHQAQTGTIYLTGSVGEGEEEIKIRVADHSECYCSESISCDPSGYALRDAIEWLAAKAGRPVPAAIERGWRAAETRKRNREAAREADIVERRSRVLAMLAKNPDVGIVERMNGGAIAAVVPAGTENRKARIKAAEAAISAAYKIVNAK